MKIIYPITLSLLLLGCSDSDEEMLIKNVSFNSSTIEACITERADFEGFTKVEEMTEVLCKGSGYDLGNLEDFNNFPNLTSVAFHSIESQSVELDNNLYIENLSVISAKNLRLFRASNSPSLRKIEFQNSNNLYSVTLDELPNLTDLEIFDAKIEVLDIANIESLENLTMATFLSSGDYYDVFSPIEYLDLTSNINLQQVYLHDTSLETLLLDGLEYLTHLRVTKSELRALDLNLTNLEELVLANNSISSINLDLLPNIKRLDLSRNQLTTINLDLNTNLEYVRLLDNPFSAETVAYLNTIDWIDDFQF